MRSGEYLQAKAALKGRSCEGVTFVDGKPYMDGVEISDGDLPIGYCCLGVAMVIDGIAPMASRILAVKACATLLVMQ